MRSLALSFFKTLVEKARRIPKRLVDFVTLSGLRGVDIVVGLLKDIVLTKSFGLGLFLDAYFVTVNYLDMVGGFFQQMGYGILLPLYNDEDVEDKSPEAIQREQENLIIAFMNYAMLTMVILTIFVVIFHQWIGQVIAPKIAKYEEGHLDELLLITFSIGALFQGTYSLRLLLIQKEQYAKYYIPGIVSTIVFIAIVYFGFPGYNYVAVLWAFPISQFVQLILYWFALGIQWRFIWVIPSLKKMFLYSLPNTMIIVCYYLFVPVDNYFLAFLPAGELSAFRYAAKIVTVLSTVTIFSLQMTLIPSLMRAGSNKDIPEMRKLIRKGFMESVLYSIPVIALGYLFGPWIIKTVFERGAFGAKDTVMLLSCFNILIFQLPFQGSWMLVSRSFNSLYMFTPFLVVGAIAVVFRVGLDYIGLKWNGMEGIAILATAHYYLTLFLGAGVMFWMLKKLELEQAQSQ